MKNIQFRLFPLYPDYSTSDICQPSRAVLKIKLRHSQVEFSSVNLTCMTIKYYKNLSVHRVRLTIKHRFLHSLGWNRLRQSERIGLFTLLFSEIANQIVRKYSNYLWFRIDERPNFQTNSTVISRKTREIGLLNIIVRSDLYMSMVCLNDNSKLGPSRYPITRQTIENPDLRIR